jgi:hypothetical protein
MPYVPRPATTIKCAHCKTAFESRHASRKYCSNSCNVLASYERTGYRGEPRATRADLERTVAKLMALVNVKPALATGQPAAKALTKKPAAKAAVKPTASKPAAKAVAKAPTKKPAAKAAVKPAADTTKLEALKARAQVAKSLLLVEAAARTAQEKAAPPAKKPAKKATKRRVKAKKPASRTLDL